MAYVDADLIRQFAEADDASPVAVWNQLAASASLIFDRACGVAENFFAKAANTATDKYFPVHPSGYINLPPFVGAATVYLENLLLTASDDYDIRDGFLVLASAKNFQISYEVYPRRTVKINAKWGFAEIPADVSQAVIDQAIFMWRRKDPAFTDMSGVSTAVVQQQLSPTCAFVAEKYKAIYSTVSI